MQKASAAFFIYAIAWLVFATFDFVGDDTIVAYQLRPVSSPEDGLPKMLDLNPRTYRLFGQTVVGQIGGSEPSRYTDCAVLDTENWTCTYGDNSGKFGFRNGDYFNIALVKMTIPDDSKNVSRFHYVLNNARWLWASESWIDKSMVLFMPFFI